MRIIGGKLGGRKIQPPAHMPHTRPTTDRAREGLFNILVNNLDIETLQTLDLFGGTGSISFELASRGAPHCTIVENDPKMYEFIKQTGAKLGLPVTVIKNEVFRFMAECKQAYGFIFAGPPYALTRIDDLPKLVFEYGLLEPGGWFVLEHTPRNDYKGFEHYKTERHYGTTIFSIFINN
jgi:16S rRNA (guanine966-N2)-methyltransferase